MGILRSYILTALSDGVVEHFREPVEQVFNGVVLHKGLPTRDDFRELRSRVDMLDYNSRELTKSLNDLNGKLRALSGDSE